MFSKATISTCLWCTCGLVTMFVLSFGVHQERTTQKYKQNNSSTVAGIQRVPGGPSRVVINVGSNSDPPLPFNDTIILAVEPLREVAASIDYVKNRFVLTAAISDHYGIALFNHYAVSSSLLQPHKSDAVWTSNGRQGETAVVPLVPMSAVLNSVGEYECTLLKTDMQGMDFVGVRGAGNLLTRCRYVFAETNCNGFTHYKNAQNDFEKDWLPHMTKLGFKPLSFCGDFYGESNILWENTKFGDNQPVPSSVCPQCYDEIIICENTECSSAKWRRSSTVQRPCLCTTGPPAW